MAQQNATVPRPFKTFTAQAAVQAAPTDADRPAAFHPTRSDWRNTDPAKQRIAGWEDYALARFSVSELVIGGTVSSAEITVYNFPSSERPANPIGKLTLQNGSFVPDSSLRAWQMGPGSFTAVLSQIAGGGSITGKVNVTAYNSDGIHAP